MILIGFIGFCLPLGQAIILDQLKDLAYAQCANYNLSFLPLFILISGLEGRCGLSADIIRGANACLGAVPGRRRHSIHRDLSKCRHSGALASTASRPAARLAS